MILQRLMNVSKNRRRLRRSRRGTAVVEMAVVAPLLLLILFGIMEFGWMFMVHESLTDAAREACRVAIMQGSTEADVRTRFEDSMVGTGLTITDSMLTIEETTLDDSEVVTVRVSVPYSDVTITGLTSFLRINRNSLSSVCSMRKENMM